MKRKNSLHLLLPVIIAMVVSGCDYFLPPGDPPAGIIVDNPAVEKKVRSMSESEALAVFTGELTNITLMYAQNKAVFIDADIATADAARNILQQCAALSGVSAAAETGNLPILYSRFDRKSKLWEIKFFAADRTLLHHSIIHLVPVSW